MHCLKRSKYQLNAIKVCVSVFLALAIVGCEGGSTQSPTGSAEVTFQPSQPTVGPCDLTIKLVDGEGKPIEDAKLTVEGNMNHAGMKPSFAEMSQADEPGVYEGTIDFTMGGDWFLLVSAEGPSGEVIETKVDVPGVNTK
ncbi:FixH family protein [Stieleria sp. JC731]|uniref:FixH family protein n=1 Tax=Pirellulaceae TaxID=2691357 RepID=UPI001E610A19|nr:FixH family protein [Stieleria sp. JC731]MCC9599155.1 FixH family protein [Stieleria sp. JC731]